MDEHIAMDHRCSNYRDSAVVPFDCIPFTYDAHLSYSILFNLSVSL